MANDSKSNGTRRPLATEDKHITRFSIHDPPLNVQHLLKALWKETREPGYRKHGGFDDTKQLRALLSSAGGSKGYLDETVRFFKKFRVLTPVGEEGAPGVVWAFNAEVADELSDQIAEKDPKNHPRPSRRFVDMADRTSNPGPEIVRGPGPLRPPTAPPPRIEEADEQPLAVNAFAGTDDDELALQEQYLREEIEKKVAELRSVKAEQRSRLERRLADISSKKEQRRREIAELEENERQLAERLEAERASILPSTTS